MKEIYSGSDYMNRKHVAKFTVTSQENVTYQKPTSLKAKQDSMFGFVWRWNGVRPIMWTCQVEFWYDNIDELGKSPNSVFYKVPSYILIWIFKTV